MGRNKLFGLFVFITIVLLFTVGVALLVIGSITGYSILIDISEFLLFSSGGAMIGALAAVVYVVDDLFIK